MGKRTVLVVAGGDRVTVPNSIDVSDVVIVAADSGVDRAYECGLRVDVAVGDFDSVSAAGLRRAEAEGARIERHPAEKDKTDLELALDEAVGVGATDIVVLGVGGGRLDHLLANFLVMTSPRYASCRITAIAGAARVHVARGGEPPTDLVGRVGETVTLLPAGGVAEGIVTTGLLYPLRDESLTPGTSRGVSNVVESLPASVRLDLGTLLAIFPGHGGI